MPTEKLIDLKAGKGLEAGIFPSAEPTAGQLWNKGQNIWFRELSIEQILGRQKIVSLPLGQATFLTQAFNFGTKSLYFVSQGIVFVIKASGNPTVFAAPEIIGELTMGADVWLEPWGTWLLATDGILQPQLWGGGGTFIPIGQGQFRTASIIKKIAQFAVAYSLDYAPNAFAWSDLDDPTTWTPSITNAARNLTIRDLDSEIVAVADLGAGHAVYSRDYMIVVQYVGPSQGWLGTPNQALSGIGAVSKYSVVSIGPYNFGLSRDGIFSTDGSTASYLDRPAVDQWIQDNIDFTKANKIAGYHNKRLGLVVWYVPLLPTSEFYSAATPRIGLAMDPKLRTVTVEGIYLSRKSFSFVDGKPIFGMEREVFDFPIVSLADGLYYESVPETLIGNFSLETHLFDGGAQEIYKMWDYFKFAGNFDSTTTVQFGYTDLPFTSSIQWGPIQALKYECPPAEGPRESIFVAMRFNGTNNFKITEIMGFGEKGGLVN